MEIIILHGENISQSWDKLEQLVASAKEKGLETVRVDSLAEKSLREHLSTDTLFKSQRLFVVREPEKISKKDFEWLTGSSKKLSDELIVYSGRSLGKDFLKKFPIGTKIAEFKLSQNIFKFLDSFYPGNSQAAILLLHQLEKTEATEKIIHFLGRHLRDLYWVGKDPKLLPYGQDWRVLKLLGQAKKFKKGEIENTISALAAADVASKTSDTAALGLLDQLIVSRLE
jgi:DNA polymerase III delta subunit